MALSERSEELPSYNDMLQLLITDAPPTYGDITGVEVDINEIYIPSADEEKQQGNRRANIEQNAASTSQISKARKCNIKRLCKKIKNQFRPKYNEDELWDNV